MASYKTAFGSHLKTEDLQGRDVFVVLESVTIEPIKGKEGEPTENKPVAHFKGKDKTLILNRTRCEQLAAIFGDDDMDLWAGPITLSPGTTKFGGKTVGCVDIKPRTAPAPKPAPVAKPAEEFDSAVAADDIPF
jgi:hypothetical protein